MNGIHNAVVLLAAFVVTLVILFGVLAVVLTVVSAWYDWRENRRLRAAAKAGLSTGE